MSLKRARTAGARKTSSRILVGLGLVLALMTLGATVPVEVPAASAKALRFYRTGQWYWAFGQIWVLALPTAMLVSGLSRRLRDFAWRVGRRWYPAFAIYVGSYLTITFLISLPLNYQRGFVRLHEYGISVESFAKWLGDAAKDRGISIFGIVGFGWVPIWLIQRVPRWWWLITALLYVPFLFCVVLIKPVIIDPLFNSFGPMHDQALEVKILDLASHASIDGGRVFEVDKSTETTAVNAYVTGIGATKRIVLWDTLIAKLEERELLFVMAHEMGHYVLGHVIRSILLSSLLIVAGLAMIQVLGRWILDRFGRQLQVNDLCDFAALPLILALFQLSYFVLSPIGLAYSRWQEHESDRFALELTKDNQAGALGFIRLQQENLGNPRPNAWDILLRSTHPSGGDRIDFCNRYRPWVEGTPLKYGHLFR